MTAPAVYNEKIRVFGIAGRILESVQISAADLDAQLPEKQYVTSGEAVHDCEQVAVTVLGLTVGIPDANGALGISGCAPVWQQQVRVDIVRCVPNWKADKQGVVPGSVISNSLIEASTDAMVLVRAVNGISAWPDNFGDVLGAISFPPPSGGFQVVTATITTVLL